MISNLFNEFLRSWEIEKDAIHKVMDENKIFNEKYRVEYNLSTKDKEYKKGWGMFGFTCLEPMDVVDAFAPIIDKLLIVKDNDGNPYLPEYDFNGLGDLIYSRGYQLKITEEILDFSFCPTLMLSQGESNPVYQVGDYAEGGIVFYVDETGQHGLVAAIEDLPGTYEWGCYGTYISGADEQAIGTGYQNTLDIVSGCSETPTASSEALNFENEGYTDWFLPSFDETQEMYFAIGQGASSGNKGGFSNSWYWTSSQANEDIAWSFSFSNGTTFNFFKTSTFMIRPIRSF